MKIILFLAAALSLSSVGLYGQEAPIQEQSPPRRVCHCKDCRCTFESHCGCYSDQGCHCGGANGSCCADGGCHRPK